MLKNKNKNNIYNILLGFFICIISFYLFSYFFTVCENFTTTKPATTKPATTKPTTTKPATTKPATTKPATTKPATTKPATTKPATTKPVNRIGSSSECNAAQKYAIGLLKIELPQIDKKLKIDQQMFLKKNIVSEKDKIVANAQLYAKKICNNERGIVWTPPPENYMTIFQNQILDIMKNITQSITQPTRQPTIQPTRQPTIQHIINSVAKIPTSNSKISQSKINIGGQQLNVFNNNKNANILSVDQLKKIQ